MGKGSKKVKRLVPAGKKNQTSHVTVTSLKVARKLTSKFHQLLGEQQRLQTSKEIDETTKNGKLEDVAARMEEMGGRDAYQAASILSQQNAMKSARYLFKTLARFGLQPVKGEPPLRVLEIGAINPQISAVPWLHVRAIDLLAQHTAVETRDFLHLPVGSGPGPDSSHAGASKAAGLTFSALPSSTSSTVKDGIVAPVVSRLKAVDWSAVRSQAAALGKARGAGRDAVGDDEGEAGGKGKKQQRAGHKRSRADMEEETTLVERHGRSIIFLPMPEQKAGALVPAATAAPARAGENVFICPHRGAKGKVQPLCGGFDILVCAMVINCVPDPADRTELLIRCRDHLVPGGLLYLSLPSRCLDMSQHITRQQFELLLTSLGFVLRDAKMTPKISLYMLQRCDVVSYARDVQSMPSVAAGPSTRAAPWLYGAGSAAPVSVASVPLSSLAPGSASSCGYGGEWKGRVVPSSAEESTLLSTTLYGPLKQLPHGEMPITGFTRTTFGVAVTPAWIIPGEHSAAPAVRTVPSFMGVPAKGPHKGSALAQKGPGGGMHKAAHPPVKHAHGGKQNSDGHRAKKQHTGSR